MSTLARVVIVIVVDALKTMRAPLNLAACPLGPDPGQVAKGNAKNEGGEGGHVRWCRLGVCASRDPRPIILIGSRRSGTWSMTVSRTPRVALYARVSTTDQRADLQLDALRQLAEQRGWTIHDEYVDEGYSGTKDRRPALDGLMVDVRRGKLGKGGIVACWRFDRFGRSLRHLVTALDDFRDMGIQFVSTQDAIDTATPSGRMMYGVIAAMSQFEAELVRERTVAGLAAARRRGVRLGRKPVHFDVDRARELRGQGLSYRELAAALGVSVGVVHRVLNPGGPRVHQSSPAAPSGTA